MFDPNSSEMKFAVESVRQASILAKRIQKEMTASQLTKGDQSPVTVADFAVQACLGYQLKEIFPQDPLVAEEDADFLRKKEGQAVLKQVVHFVRSVVPNATEKSVCDWIDRGNAEAPQKRFWTLDPVDGTKGFLRGDQFAVTLALVESGQVRLGVIGCPNLNEKNEKDLEGPGILAAAVRGQGAWRTSLSDKNQDYQRMKVSSRSKPAEIILMRSVERAHTNETRTDIFIRLFKMQKKPVLMDSQAKHVVLANAGADLFFYLLPKNKPHTRMKIWDVTAGAILVEEAGGKLSDLEGNPLNFQAGKTLAYNPGLLITNGKIHDAALNILQAIEEQADTKA